MLGFKTYLYVFARYKIRSLHRDGNEKDFFLFMDQLKGNGVILDIGANIGVMACHLSKRFPKARILAFEPIPFNADCLDKVIRKYNLKNVEAFRMALGDETGEVEMVLPVEKKVRMQGLSHVVHESIDEFNDGIRLKVPVSRLDDIKELNGQSEKVIGIKMDVENFEYFVLKGGEKLLTEHQPVIYTELWENENRYKCFDLIKALGYKTQVVHNGSLVDYVPEVHKTQNFIFIPTR